VPTSAAGDSRWVGATAVLFTILVVSGSAPPDMSRGVRPTGLDGRLRSAGGPALPCVPRDGPCATRSPAPGAPVRAIHEIQGAAHRSPLNGRRVSRVAGVVTAVDKTGFWLQDPRPDDDPATS
jgi:hypothetical protein